MQVILYIPTCFLYLIRYNVDMANIDWQVNYFKHNNRSPIEEWLDSLPIDTRVKIAESRMKEIINKK